MRRGEALDVFFILRLAAFVAEAGVFGKKRAAGTALLLHNSSVGLERLV